MGLVLAWLLKNWRLFAALAIVLALIWAVSVINGWHKDSVALPQVKAQAEKDLKQANLYSAGLQAAYDTAYNASRSFQLENQALRDAATAAGPAPVIRVCKPARVPVDHADGKTPARPDGATPVTGVLSESLEFDTGPLYGDADKGDGLSAQIRGLQAFIKSNCGG